MGYIKSIRDGEDEFDLEYVQNRMKRLKAWYMNKRSAKDAVFQLRAFIPGPIQTWKFYFECFRNTEMVEKTRIQEWVWDSFTKGKQTTLMSGGIEFFTIETFKIIK